MGEEAEMSLATADLLRLGRTTAQPEFLEHCDGLAELILSELGITDTLAKGSRANLMRKMLFHAAREARREAEIVAAGAANNNLSCRAAALAELLGFTDDVVFERVRKKRRDEAQWKVEVEENKPAKRMRDLRASVWINLRPGTVRKEPYKERLPRAFEAYLRSFIASHRNELEEFAKRYLGPGSAIVEDPQPPQVEQPRFAQTPVVGPTARSRPSGPTDRILEDALAELAVTIYSQLEQQQARADIADRFATMPVRWSEAAGYPADQWSNVRGDRERSDPLVLSGMIDDIGDLYEKKIPSGRLVVLGEGGAGKSVLVRELAMAMLGRRGREDQVPVVFSLASWNPHQQSLRRWMVEQLEKEYPDLKEHAGRRTRRRIERRTIANRLVETGAILPILDGLDEISATAHPVALQKINSSLASDDRVVVTSRSAEYVSAVSEGTVLSRAAVIELKDLTPDDLATYLPRKSNSQNVSEWVPVVARLRATPRDAEATVLLEALSRPLMAFLARSVYSDTSADPIELLDGERFPDVVTLTDHLLDSFIETVYAPQPSDDGPAPVAGWTPGDARRWLGFLAILQFSSDEQKFYWQHLHFRTSGISKFLVIALGFISLIGFFPLATAHTAPEAKWEGTQINYEDNLYTRTDNGAANDPRGVPEGANVFYHLDRSVFPWKMHLIYFAADVDVDTAEKATYRTVSFDSSRTGAEQFGSISHEAGVTLEPYRLRSFPLEAGLRSTVVLFVVLFYAIGVSISRREKHDLQRTVAEGPRRAWDGAQFHSGPILALRQSVPALFAVGVGLFYYANAGADEFFVIWLGALLALVGVFFLTIITLSKFRAVDPPRQLRVDTAEATTLAALYGVMYGAISLWAFVKDAGDVPAIILLIVALILPGVFLSVAYITASGAWYFSCVEFFVRGLLPLRLMRFLEDAYRRGALRRSGSSYEFRHAELQERLARVFIEKYGGLAGIDRTVADARGSLVVARLESERMSSISDKDLPSIFAKKSWWKIRESWPVLVAMLRNLDLLDEAVAECRRHTASAPAQSHGEPFLLYFDQMLALIDLMMEQGRMTEASVEYRDFLREIKKSDIFPGGLDEIDGEGLGFLLGRGLLADSVRQRMVSVQERLESQDSAVGAGGQ